jgi:hypothetical protein
MLLARLLHLMRFAHDRMAALQLTEDRGPGKANVPRKEHWEKESEKSSFRMVWV